MFLMGYRYKCFLDLRSPQWLASNSLCFGTGLTKFLSENTEGEYSGLEHQVSYMESKREKENSKSEECVWLITICVSLFLVLLNLSRSSLAPRLSVLLVLLSISLSRTTVRRSPSFTRPTSCKADSNRENQQTTNCYFYQKKKGNWLMVSFCVLVAKLPKNMLTMTSKSTIWSLITLLCNLSLVLNNLMLWSCLTCMVTLSLML